MIQRKKRNVVFAAFSIFGMLILGLLFALAPEQTITDEALGRLVFTDMNPYYQPFVYDLEHNIREPLTSTSDEGLGRFWSIDENFVFVDMCFAQNNPMFCSAPVEEVLSAQDLDRFEIARQTWQTDYGSPVWSPDGRFIAFVRWVRTETGLRGDIQVMNSDGTNLRDLTPNDDNDGFGFTWSPDSVFLAFACNNGRVLCIANIEMGEINRLSVASSGEIWEPTWSPDGAHIAFMLLHSGADGSELYIIDSDGSNPRSVSGQGFVSLRPTWSPNSAQIAMSADTLDAEGYHPDEIYVVNADGTNLLNISKSPSFHEFSPVWSPDNRYIAFYSIQNDGTYLYIAKADGTNLRRLTDNHTMEVTDVPGPALFWIP